jgi:hypothetical protein
MPYATYIDLDTAGSIELDRLTSYIEELGENICTPRQLGFGHHITLALYDELDVPRMVEILAGVVESIQKTAIQLPALGVFPGEQSALFVAPYVTADLLLIHKRYHQLTAACGHGRPYYHPGSWFPHATLAVNLSQHELEAAFGTVSGRWTPISAKLTSLRLVRFSPVETIWHARLANPI